MAGREQGGERESTSWVVMMGGEDWDRRYNEGAVKEEDGTGADPSWLRKE